MTDVLLAFLAIYFIAVGGAGNGRELWEDTLEAMPDFLPWVFIIGALGFLAASPYTQKLGRPIVALLLLAYVLKNSGELQKSFDAAYSTLREQFGAYKSTSTQHAPSLATDTANPSKVSDQLLPSNSAPVALENGGIL